MIMMLTSITLITLATFLIWHFLIGNVSNSDPSINVHAQQLSSKERQELTVQIDDIMTNLSDTRYLVRLSFSFLLENKKTKEEMELIIPSVKAIINRTLADTRPDEMMGSEGIDNLNAKLLQLVNPILTEGDILEIEVTERLITVQN